MFFNCLSHWLNAYACNYSIKTLKHSTLKKIFFIVAILATVLTQNSFGQESSKQSQVPQLLSLYYNIKNALVAGDANSAASNAEFFVKTANSIDYKVISEGNINALVKDAGKISEAKDIKKQREYFANFSSTWLLLQKR